MTDVENNWCEHKAEYCPKLKECLKRQRRNPDKRTYCIKNLDHSPRIAAEIPPIDLTTVPGRLQYFIKFEAKRKGLTLKEIGSRVFVSETAVCQWANPNDLKHRPNPNQIRDLEKAMELKEGTISDFGVFLADNENYRVCQEMLNRLAGQEAVDARRKVNAYNRLTDPIFIQVKENMEKIGHVGFLNALAERLHVDFDTLALLEKDRPDAIVKRLPDGRTALIFPEIKTAAER